MKREARLSFRLSLLLLAISVATAQEERPPTQLVSTVEAEDFLVIPAGSGMSVLPAGDGEYYLQQITGPDYRRDRIVRRDFNGGENKALDVSELAKSGKIPAHEYYLMDYSADPRGGLAAVVAWGDKHPQVVSHFAILDVNDQGDLRSFFELSDGFAPTKAAAFFSGSYLIVGNYAGEPQSLLRLQIRDYRGEIVVRDLGVFSDTSARSSKGGQDHGRANPGKSEEANLPWPLNDRTEGLPPGVSMAFAMASTDDDHVFAYSVRNPDIIEKISNTGEHKAISIVKPPVLPGQVLRPIDMYKAHGGVLLQLAAFSTTPDPQKGIVAQKHFWSAYESSNGSLIETYASDSEQWVARSILVGYEPHNFYFLEGHLRPSGEAAYSLLHATPK